jgi:photosystem II stability/assembly factor-like uncharacterized protein
MRLRGFQLVFALLVAIARVPGTRAYWTADVALANSRMWREVACSANCSRVVATIWGSDGSDGIAIWDAGDTTARYYSPMKLESPLYYAVAISADGMKIAAGQFNRYIQISTDGGYTWAAKYPPNGKNSYGGYVGSGHWYQFGASDDMSTLVATDYEAGTVWITKDLGATWTSWEPDVDLAKRRMQAATSSSDGTRLAVAAYGGGIYVSADAGDTWTQADEDQVGSDKLWARLASSRDGSRLACTAAGTDGYVVVSSDFGVTWRQVTSLGSPPGKHGIAMSGDGLSIVVAQNPSNLYASTDSGRSWRESVCAADAAATCAGTKAWTGLAASSDFRHVYGLANYGYPYRLELDDSVAQCSCCDEKYRAIGLNSAFCKR